MISTQISTQEPVLFAIAPHLNLDHLHQLSEGCATFERELLQIFLADSWTHVAALRAALVDGNLRQIQYSTHHLKGSGANVGAMTIQTIAATLEQQAIQGELQEGDRLLEALEYSLEQIQCFQETRNEMGNNCGQD